jgi:hypothetical protein
MAGFNGPFLTGLSKVFPGENPPLNRFLKVLIDDWSSMIFTFFIIL